MYIPIQINLDNLIEEFNLDGSQVSELAAKLTNSLVDLYFSALRQNVNTSLITTRNLYLNSLSVKNIDSFTKEIILSKWLPNALESGVSSFDMKKGFLKSSKAKISKKGSTYLAIPMNRIISNNSRLSQIKNIINKNKNQSVNFRVVSSVSSKASWIYPGLKPRKFFEKSLDNISSQIPILSDTIIDNFLKKEGF